MKRRRQKISESIIQTVKLSDIHMIMNPVSSSYQYNNLIFSATAYPIFPIELLGAFFFVMHCVVEKVFPPTFSRFMVVLTQGIMCVGSHWSLFIKNDWH